MPKQEVESFITELVNNRHGPVAVTDFDGVMIAILQPGQTLRVESATPRTTFAPYTRVTWNEDGTVDCELRPNWIDPYSALAPWKVIVENQSGKEVEEVEVAGNRVFLMRGIPYAVFVSATAEEARWARIALVNASVDECSSGWNGYSIRNTVLKKVTEERQANELALVLEDRERILKKQAAEK
jgi:hypothetical protein